MKLSSSSPRKIAVEFAFMFLLLLAVLSLVLIGVYLPGQTLFSNDGPLGNLMSQCHQLPGRFTGCWDDLNAIGFNTGAAPPGISYILLFLLKPIWFSKLYALISLVILGLGAWCFFTGLKLARSACMLGGLAAALNSCFFSVACWGVAAQAITVGMIFFALAALMDTTSRLRWLRVILAGLAVGMAVVEGSDVGAIYSLYVAAFIIYQAWIGDGSRTKRVTTGLGRLTLVALCAGFIAAQTIVSLVDTSIKGVVGTQQDVQTKEARWDWATQWSLPIREATGLVVPGIFGYRMDTPAGGDYWGDIGRDPAVDRYLENGKQGPPPHGFMRYSGGGFYTGVLVVVLAFWALAQSTRKKDSIFNFAQRRWLWFWVVVALVSALLSFGRYAPFYQLIYALPYFSTIRNPVKFLGLVSFTLVVLFTYGIDGLSRRYMSASGSYIPPRWDEIKNWWAKAGKFEKAWLRGCGLALGMSLLAWLIYASDSQTLVDYLQTIQFDSSQADAIASFSIRQVGWFVLFFVLTVGLTAGIFSGIFAGKRAQWGSLVLGLLLLADLGRANLPWVVYWNYQEKYASNPIIDCLRNQPYEHRVTILPNQSPPDPLNFDKLYHVIWLQQQFHYYNIQSLDVVQLSRMPEDLAAYVNAQKSPGIKPLIHFWQLTNTRYMLGAADALDSLNQEVNPVGQKFHVLERFEIVPKPAITNPATVEDLTVVLNTNGSYALFEFTGALPRVKLFSTWQINADNQAVLKQLASPTFDPSQTVLVAGDLPAASTTADTNQFGGTVDFKSYAPKDIVLKSDASLPTVLLLNDRFDPNWKVFVDGDPKTLLRCNFIMRGVYLTRGAHTVEFRFQPPFRLFYVSAAATLLGLLVLILILVSGPGISKKI